MFKLMVQKLVRFVSMCLELGPLLRNFLLDSIITSCIYYVKVAFLGVVGGSSEQETVQRVMAATFTARLAQQFNWHGKKGKKASKVLN